MNKNLKDWNVLQVIYRNDPGDHPYVFRACAVMKQIGINNGKTLFQTGYKDPPYDPPDPDNPPNNTGWQRRNYIGGGGAGGGGNDGSDAGNDGDNRGFSLGRNKDGTKTAGL